MNDYLNNACPGSHVAVVVQIKESGPRVAGEALRSVSAPTLPGEGVLSECKLQFLIQDREKGLQSVLGRRWREKRWGRGCLLHSRREEKLSDV